MTPVPSAPAPASVVAQDSNSSLPTSTTTSSDAPLVSTHPPVSGAQYAQMTQAYVADKDSRRRSAGGAGAVVVPMDVDHSELTGMGEDAGASIDLQVRTLT